MAEVRARYIVIRCPDFRFHAAYQKVYDELSLEEEGFDLLSWAGVSLPLSKPSNIIADLIVWLFGFLGIIRPLDFLIGQINTLVSLHENTTVLLIDHDDCGAYGAEGVEDSEDEHRQHGQNLRRASNLIHDNCPKINEVKKLILFLDGSFKEVTTYQLN